MKINSGRTKILLSNSLVAGLARVANLLIGIAMVPIIVNNTSHESYALLSVVISIATLVNYADFGLALAIVNAIASANENNKIDAEATIAAVWAGILAIFSIGILTCVGGLILAQYLELEGGVIEGVLLAGLFVVAAMPTGVTQRILFAQQRNGLANVIQTLGRLASLAATSWAVFNGFNAQWIFIVTLLGVPVLIAWIGTIYVLAPRGAAWMRPHPTRATKVRLIGAIKTGFAFTVLQLVVYTENVIDTVLVAAFVSIDQVPALDVSSKLFGYIPAIISVASYPIWPAIVKARSESDHGWVDRIVSQAYLYTTLTSILVAAVIWVASKDMIMAWTGKDLSLGRSTSLIMGCFAVISCVNLTQSMILTGYGLIKQQVKIAIIYVPVLLVAKIAGAVLLGVVGILWAGCICASIKIFFLHVNFLDITKRERII